MHQQPQGQSIWGTINTCIEIALDVYAIIAKDRDGNEQQGIMVKKSRAGELLSEKAVSAGKESGEWLCYGKDTKGIPLHEILLHRIADCKRMEKLIMEQIGELKRDGKQDWTDYFGECQPPKTAPECETNEIRKIRNGVYLINDLANATLAINGKIADQFLIPVAVGYGRREGEYLFYHTPESAIVLNELKDIFEEVAALVISEDSLYASLHKHYPAYTSFYNQCMPETAQIPKVDAPADLFLAGQLLAGQEAVQKGEGMEAVGHDWEFGEQVDYGIGE